MVAPFLKENPGRIDRAVCWWCDKGRQSREHLLKECTAWTSEIRMLWRKVGEALGNRK